MAYSADDVYYFTSSVNAPVDNMAGRFGVFFTTPFVLIYGRYASYFASFASLVLGINFLTTPKLGRILIKMSLLVMSMMSLSMLLGTVIPNADFLAAGVLGVTSGAAFNDLLPQWATITLLSLVMLLSLAAGMKIFRVIAVFLAKVLLFPLALFKPREHPEVQGNAPDLEDEISRETIRPTHYAEEFQTDTNEDFETETISESPMPEFLNSENETQPEISSESQETFRRREEPEFLKHNERAAEDETSPITGRVLSEESSTPDFLSGDGKISEVIGSRFDRFIFDEDESEPKLTSENETFNPDRLELSDFLPSDEEIDGTEEIASVASAEETTERTIPEPTEETEESESSEIEEKISGLQIHVSKEEEPEISDGLDTETPAAKSEPEDDRLSTQVSKDTVSTDRVSKDRVSQDRVSQGKVPKDEITNDEVFTVEIDEPESDYRFPKSGDLSQSFVNFSEEEANEEIKKNIETIESTFESFKIDISVAGYSRGPAITRYEFIPPEGLKVKSIFNLQDDLAVKLGTKSIRLVAPIGNKSMIGVEVPNRHRKTIVLRDIIESDSFSQTKAELPLIMGTNLTGKTIIQDLASMPHLLIAGTTGSGKSVYVNALISGLVFKKSVEELRFIMIDPKMVELELYNGIPHLLAPIITQPEEAIAALDWAVREMDRRYSALSQMGVRNLKEYNSEVKKINAARKKKKEEPMEIFPYIVVIIDEFANLMLRSPKETEKAISRLAAMARAVGIHLVIATQRPSVDVVTGIIKANFPSRIAFRVISKTDSRTILDENGADSLLDKGDMLFRYPSQRETIRMQAPFVSNSDVESVCRTLKQNGTADYEIDLNELTGTLPFGDTNLSNTVDAQSDELFADALKEAVEKGEVSASYLQRKFRIGYNRASRIVQGMEDMGILAPATGSSKPREVLISQEDLVHYL